MKAELNVSRERNNESAASAGYKGHRLEMSAASYGRLDRFSIEEDAGLLATFFELRRRIRPQMLQGMSRHSRNVN